MFKTDGYEYIRNFLDEPTRELMSIYYENKIRHGDWKPAVRKEKAQYSSYDMHGDSLTEAVLLKKLPLVSRICGKELYPTYSYVRIYQEGNVMERHVDRPSCEISLTVNIFTKENRSIFYVEDLNSNVKEFDIEPGDALMYLGEKIYHWRKPIEKDQFLVQFMLHYVDKNGKNKDYKYDKRPNLGYPLESRKND